MAEDRRKFKRIKYSLRVICKDRKGACCIGRTTTLNVSRRGFCVETRNIMNPNEILSFKVTTYDKEPKQIYRGRGTVMWMGKNDEGMGLAGIKTARNTNIGLIPA